MTATPGDFYKVAESLQFEQKIGSKDPGIARTVAGRAYYAAYLATRDTLRRICGNPDYKLDHSRLTNFLKTGVRDDFVEEFGEMLEELRAMRTDADYRLDATITSQNVGLKLRDAKYLLETQDRLEKKLGSVVLPASE